MSQGRRTEPKHAVREKLLASATKLFNRRGYAATSVREIVQAAGVTKPVLYHYFGSKEGIYLEIMRHFLGHFEARLGVFRTRAGSAGERVRRLCDEMFSLFLEHTDSVKLLYAIYYGPPQGAPRFDFDAFYAKLFAAMRQAVQEGIRCGEFRRRNANDMTQAVMGALTVAVESHLAHKPVFIGNRGLRRIVDSVFAGIQSDQLTRKGTTHAGQSNRHSSSGTLPRRRRLHQQGHRKG